MQRRLTYIAGPDPRGGPRSSGLARRPSADPVPEPRGTRPLFQDARCRASST